MSERRPGGAKGPGPPVALTLLLPGVPQWLLADRERGLILAGAYLSAMGVGLFAWGTLAGLALLGFAYLTHVTSVAGAIRRWAFPGFGLWVAPLTVSAGLAIGCYGPLLLVGSAVAWPGRLGGGTGEEYLVNRLAYRSSDPTPGDRVWLGGDAAEGRLAEVLAGPGEEVEWDGRRLRIGGRRVAEPPFRRDGAPRALSFRVPEGQILVAAPRPADPTSPGGWDLVPRDRVEGRAWARAYPIWGRRLLGP